MRTALIAALALVCVASNADARVRRIVSVTDPNCNILFPCQDVGSGTYTLARISQDYALGRISSSNGFIRGRLICAVNVNAELARRGIRGTGSAAARSFLGWGTPSNGQVGDVAVFSRRGGGHVAIVAGRDEYGRILYLNPSSRRQAWQVGPYHRQPIAFRSAS